MKQFNDNLKSIQKELEQALAIKGLIDALPYKLNEPVIYNGRPALVYGFQIVYDKSNSMQLQVHLIAVTDESDTRDGLIHKTMQIKAHSGDVAPYTDAAKLLFSKG